MNLIYLQVPLLTDVILSDISQYPLFQITDSAFVYFTQCRFVGHMFNEFGLLSFSEVTLCFWKLSSQHLFLLLFVLKVLFILFYQLVASGHFHIL